MSPNLVYPDCDLIEKKPRRARAKETLKETKGEQKKEET